MALSALPTARSTLRWRIAALAAAGAALAVAIQVLVLGAVHAEAVSDHLGAMAAASLVAAALAAAGGFALAGRLTRQIEIVRDAAVQLAAGDLTVHPEVRLGGEVRDLAASLSALAGQLQATMREMGEASEQIDRGAAEILGSVTRQAAMASQQAAAINETSTTATEIAQTSKQATEHADSVIQMTQRSEELSRDGLHTVEDAVHAAGALGDQVKRIAATMSELSARVQQVGDIVATVKDLAEQSNLLALNASIEASRAGEHGRGFAVVAMEMRNLAEQSKASAVQVRQILSEIQKGAREAVEVTEEGAKRATSATMLARSAGEAIEGLAMVIRESAVSARQIANNTRQQTIGVEQMVTAIAEISQTVGESAAGTRAIERSTAALGEVSRRLGGAIRRFHV